MKEDIAANPIYRQIARHSLKELHHNLLKSLYSFFMTKKEGPRTLVVAGQGPEALPYSTNLDLLEEMLGDGSMAMFDYNPDIIESSVDALVHPRFDGENVAESKRKGIEARDYFLADIPPEETIDLRKLGRRHVFVRQGDLSESFKFADGSVSAFDATLAIHHVTAYRQGLDHVISEVHRILEPGGLFHWGDGNVDMRYQEEKIHRVATLLQRFYNVPVIFGDDRSPARDFETSLAHALHLPSRSATITHALYLPSITYTQIPLIDTKTYNELKAKLEDRIEKNEEYVLMSATKTGGIHIYLNGDGPHLGGGANIVFAEHLKEQGFQQVYAIPSNSSEERIILPIIDQGMREDREQFMDPVRNYYEKIIALNTQVFADRPDVATKVLAADHKEFGDAYRGLFEYYTDPQKIVGMLQSKGFRDVNYTPDSHGIWFNITARKM